jgi:hypothetical protein
MVRTTAPTRPGDPIPVAGIRAEAYQERKATGDNDGSGHFEATGQA